MEARSPNGQRLTDPVNVNHNLLDRINDDELKRLVQTEASRTEKRQGSAFRANSMLSWLRKLTGGSFVALKNLEILFGYDLELNCLRIRATNQKHILLLLPGEKVGDRITTVPNGRDRRTTHRTLPQTYGSRESLRWELSEE